jgi:nitrous oxidase accessory protein NosD
MRYLPVRARAAARIEPLEARQLLSLTPALPVTDPTAPADCGCGGGHDANTIHVDDDRQQCRDADFTSIQAAVLAAPPFSTIHVCPGLYNEQVTVPKTLTLLGSSHDRSAARSTGGADPQHDSIVQFETIFGIFDLEADNIVLDGFVVENNPLGPGVFTSRLFSGYCIERNTIQNNVFGLYINNRGPTQAVVRGNWFNGNNQPGAAGGDGIYSDQGLFNALVERNVFTGHESASMVFTSFLGINQDVVVTHNAIIDDSSIAVFNTENMVIEKNFLRRPSGSGIFLGGGNTNVLVDGNLVDASTSSGIVDSGENGLPADVGVVITRNLIGDAGGNGVSLRAADGVQVKRNIVLRSALSGIRLGNTSGNNLIAGNLSLHNMLDGVRVVEQSSNNRIVGNTMRQNDEHDAHDDTVGGGTAGTANYWIDNNCKTENRPGICGHSDDDDAFYSAEESSYSTTLSADPLAGGDIVIPTYDTPAEPIVPVLLDLGVLSLPTVLGNRTETPWLDADAA